MSSSGSGPPAEILGHLRAILDALPLATMVLAPGYRVILANRATLELSGQSDPVSGGLMCYELSRGCGLPCHGPGESCPMNQVLASKSPVKQIHRSIDSRGRERLTEVSIAPVIDEAGKVTHAVGVLQDVTGKRSAGEADLDPGSERSASPDERSKRLITLVQALTHSAQRDRERLAHVLREEVQQLLFAAVLKLGDLQRKIENRVELDEDLRELAGVIGHSMELSNFVTSELYPSILSTGSMREILEWLATSTSDKHGLKIEMDLDAGADIARQEVRVFLFEAVRELLLNVVKHAKVDRAHVRMQRRGERGLEILVVDEGVGFDPEALTRNEAGGGAFGLLGIRERIELWGGWFEIDTSPSRGCRIKLGLSE